MCKGLLKISVLSAILSLLYACTLKPSPVCGRHQGEALSKRCFIPEPPENQVTRSVYTTEKDKPVAEQKPKAEVSWAKIETKNEPEVVATAITKQQIVDAPVLQEKTVTSVVPIVPVVPAAPETPVTKAETSPFRGMFTVQLGIYNRSSRRDKVSDKLNTEFPDTTPVKFETPSKQYGVRLGNYDQQDKAQSLLQKIQDAGYTDAYVRKIKRY